MTLTEKLDIARSAGRILASIWREKVDPDDAIQEAYVVALEKPATWWGRHTRSYLVNTIKANIWARLIRKHYFVQVGPKRRLERRVEVPLEFDESGRVLA